jgi:CPA1 family monovalent cation:H+ antiporter
VWEVAVFVMNVLAFVLIGLQMRGIVERIKDGEWSTYLVAAGATCAAVILVRIAWVMSYNSVARLWVGRLGRRLPRPIAPPTVGSGLVVSWCGMRGIVTLAAALALPEGTEGTFPHRDLIVFCSFCVVLVTLVVQGMTLAPLLRWLGLRDDGSVERELSVARTETAKAALAALEQQEPRAAAELLRREYRARLRPGQHEPARLAALQQRAVQAQRRALIDLRARDVIGDDAFHAAEEEIDLLELTADARIRPDAQTDGITAPEKT